MICKIKNCTNLITANHPAEKKGLCVRCWEELEALDEMRRKRDENDRKGPPTDCLPAFA